MRSAGVGSDTEGKRKDDGERKTWGGGKLSKAFLRSPESACKRLYIRSNGKAGGIIPPAFPLLGVQRAILGVPRSVGDFRVTTPGSNLFDATNGKGNLPVSLFGGGREPVCS